MSKQAALQAMIEASEREQTNQAARVPECLEGRHTPGGVKMAVLAQYDRELISRAHEGWAGRCKGAWHDAG